MASELTPVQSTNKANMGAGGAAGGMTVGSAVALLWSLTSWFPQEWADSPSAIVAVVFLLNLLFGAAGSWIATYRAREMRLESDAPKIGKDG
ncbi:hypothetical protein [Jiella marina]|uniref:hypothetical protein n=1 Tax=Jiella sp. LLJ827 TaxID=2917712 RepID=UPI002100B7BC|nr:hypothetical protein [Jiella sp. LLJ827]MCQ0986385.1 hypothetical protein [Jiella sp. LLJ827]